MQNNTNTLGKMKRRITRPEAIIFDFDGVIVNSELIKFKRLKQILAERGLRLKQSDFQIMVGKKTASFLKERFGKRLSAREIHKIEEERRSDQLRHLKEYTRPVVGAIDFIRQVKKNNILICLATGTSKKIVQKTLRQLKLNHAFDKLVTGEDFKSSKPNPEVNKIALRKLNVSPKKVLVIEDSSAGVSAAKRAGLKCVAITTTQPKKQLAKADWVVHSFSELRKQF